MPALSVFSEQTRAWFERTFDAPTPAQALGWPAIAKGGHVLVQAPTGSGKTLAAFLYGIDRLTQSPGEGLRLLYVSPLKALNYDIERNLRGPLAGLRSELRVAVRTGDTPARERQAMLRNPPDILITTPESLFLLLTSQGREMLRTVETLIVDEVHAVAGTKRGAHLVLSLERLERLLERPMQRIGLSATQRPLDEIGRFVAGGRPIELVDAGRAKELDLEVVVPLEDMGDLTASQPVRQPEIVDGSYITDGVGPATQSIWPSIYPELVRLVEQHRSTSVFVNNRRLAERLALRLNELAESEIARAHHGSLAREQRLEVEELLKKGEIPCLVATSSLELGIDMGAVDLVVQVESPKSVARGLQRVGRAGHGVEQVSRGRIFPKFRGDLLECAVVARRMREGLIEPTVVPRNALDVLAQQVVAIAVAADPEAVEVDRLHALVTRAYPYSELSRELLGNVLGRALGEFARWAVDQDEQVLQRDYDLDERAARNLLVYLREQQAATRVIPSERTIVVERFRDEIGDWRLCVLSPYGGRVHAAWGLALSARIRERFGLESDAIWTDDGIVLHLPDLDAEEADSLPSADELVLLEPEEIEQAGIAELAGSALFGARFRENSSRP